MSTYWLISRDRKAPLFSEAFLCDPAGAELDPFGGRFKTIKPFILLSKETWEIKTDHWHAKRL